MPRSWLGPVTGALIPTRRGALAAATHDDDDDVLTVAETEEVSFELGDEHSPGVIHIPSDKSYTAVVMPMRV